MADERSRQHPLRDWELIQPEVSPLETMRSLLDPSGSNRHHSTTCLRQTKLGVTVMGAQ